VIDIETALLQQLLNIAQRKRIAKIPPDRTKYEAGFSLPPFEDRGSDYHFAILSRHQPATLKFATHPLRQILEENCGRKTLTRIISRTTTNGLRSSEGKRFTTR
jgi:hypothetical protein